MGGVPFELMQNIPSRLAKVYYTAIDIGSVVLQTCQERVMGKVFVQLCVITMVPVVETLS